MRAKAESEMAEALRRGDLHTAFSKAVMTGRLTREMIDDAKRLLHFLGIPYVQAPSEAEAQAAYMASQGHVWAANSQDYDSILFGAPRLVRYITIQGKEYLPSTGKARPLKPELIEAKDLLASLGVSREQIIDIAILIGTDFNEGVRGVGPKTALKLIREKGRVENLPDTIRSRVSENFQEVRELFLNPKVTRDFPTTFGPLREKELLDFLCIQKNFSRNRVALAVDRMKKSTGQSILPQWAEKN